MELAFQQHKALYGGAKARLLPQMGSGEHTQQQLTKVLLLLVRCSGGRRVLSREEDSRGVSGWSGEIMGREIMDPGGTSVRQNLMPSF